VNAEQWNALYPVGTPVFAYPGFRPEDASDARRLVTRTRTAAQLSASGDPVVWVEGEGSYICLTHVDPVSEDVWEEARAAEKPAETETAPDTPVRLSPEREAEIAARAEAATPGPWEANARIGIVTNKVGDPLAVFGGGAQDRADAKFTAHAREDVPALLAELAAVRAERDAFRDQRNNVFATNERLLVKVDESGQARLRAENETRTVKREARDELAAFRSLELGDLDGRVSASCAEPGHPTWLRAEDDTRGCPWCRVAELERPAVEAHRNEVRSNFTSLIAQAQEDRDHEGAFALECQLRDREEQWKREDEGPVR
jgi:hypothetical protein